MRHFGGLPDAPFNTSVNAVHRKNAASVVNSVNLLWQICRSESFSFLERRQTGLRKIVTKLRGDTCKILRIESRVNRRHRGYTNKNTR